MGAQIDPDALPRPSLEAINRLEAFAREPGSNVTNADGSWYSPQAEALYAPLPTGETRWCIVCLRAFREDLQSLVDRDFGGREQLYCGASCRGRATDPERASLPTAWGNCASCGTGFLRLTLEGPAYRNGKRVYGRNRHGKTLCPPPALPMPRRDGRPVGGQSYWATSPCAKQRHRDLSRERMARVRAAQESEIVTAVRAALRRRTEPIERLAAEFERTIAEAEGLAAWGEAVMAHLDECSKRRGCASPGHRRLVLINRVRGIPTGAQRRAARQAEHEARLARAEGRPTAERS